MMEVLLKQGFQETQRNFVNYFDASSTSTTTNNGDGEIFHKRRIRSPDNWLEYFQTFQ